MSFLGDLTAFASMFGTGGAFGKDRPSWKDLQFMADTDQRLQPQRTATTGAFLEGLAPYQAGAYNQYQDATFQGDTDRHIGRIQQTGDALGMSPWELTGAGGANPLPTQSFGDQQAPKGGEYMSALVPLQTAKMQTQAQLASTLINAETQKYTVDKTTNQQQYTTDQQQGGGQLAQSQIKQIASQIAVNDVTQAKAWTDVDVANQQMVLNLFDTIIKAAPKDTIQLPGFTSTSTPGWRDMAQILQNLGFKAEQDHADRVKILKSLPPDDWGDLKRGIINTAKTAGDMAGDAMKGIGDFLNGLFK